MTNFARLVPLLVNNGVEFIVVGGIALRALGGSRPTDHLDVVYRRTPENLKRLVTTLAPHHPYLRGAPPGLPFQWDVLTLRQGSNFTLTTDLGDLDLLGEMAGGGFYEDMLDGVERFDLFGVNCQVLNVDQLLQAKQAAGRIKDILDVADLHKLKEIQARQSSADAPSER